MHIHPTRLTKIIATSAAAVVLVGAALAAPAGATAPPTEPPAVALTLVAEVGGPVDLTWRDGDAALYVVGQGGTVSQVAGDTTTVVLDITDLTTGEGERGLLGLAFSPAGDLAYVNFTDLNGDTNIAEFAVDAAGVFNRDSLRTVLTIEQPFANHNGGDLAFGPDGMLYIGMGDGGDGGDPQRYAQNLESLLGKMLRIDPATPSGDLQYTVPADNPFVGQDGALGEIWSVGLRNPWRFSFDAETGDLWIADVGQGAREEIDYAPSGQGARANYGWNLREGAISYSGEPPADNVEPVFDYGRDGGRCSVTGGYVYRGAAVPGLRGAYLYSDYCDGVIRALRLDGREVEQSVSLDIAAPAVVSFGQDNDGELYVLSLEGPVYRLVPG